MTATRRHRLRHRLLLLAAALFLSVVLVEVVFRIVGPPAEYAPPRIYTPTGQSVPLAEIVNFTTRGGALDRSGQGPRGRLQPNLRLKFGYDRPRWSYFDAQGSVPVVNNSLGFRDDEFPLQKPPGEFRVLALGDSFTYGCGVRLEDSWPQLVEAGLRAGGNAVQVINCGLACGPGARTPAQYTPWVEADGLQFAPDLVIVGFCLNDMGDHVPMIGFVAPEREPVLGGFSHLLDWLVWRQAFAAAARTPRDLTPLVTGQPQMWQESQAALRRLKEVLDSKGIPLALAVFPMLSQLDADYPYAGLHRLVGDFCAEAGIPCIDLLPAFHGRVAEDLWVHPTDQHPNDVGHRLLADGILAFLRQRNLVPDRLR